MSQPRLNHNYDAYYYVHKDRTDDINLEEIVRDFINVNDRKIKH